MITMLFVSLITLLSMLKIWTGMFWEKGSGDRPQIWHAHYLTHPRPLRSRSVIHPRAGYRSHRAQVSTLTSTQTIIEADESTVARRINFSLAAPSVVLALITICLGLGAQFLWP